MTPNDTTCIQRVSKRLRASHIFFSEGLGMEQLQRFWYSTEMGNIQFWTESGNPLFEKKDA